MLSGHFCVQPTLKGVIYPGGFFLPFSKQGLTNFNAHLLFCYQ